MNTPTLNELLEMARSEAEEKAEARKRSRSRRFTIIDGGKE